MSNAFALVDWWDTSYPYRQPITLKTSSIGLSGTITHSHVMLIDINSSQSDFWTALNGDANSVRFVDDANTVLKWHIDDLNFVSQRLLAWVKIDTDFSNSTDKVIYVYYGKAGATTDQNVAGTYPSTYKAVYHFNNTSDATGNGYNFSNLNVTFLNDTNSKFGYSAHFDASKDGLSANGLPIKASLTQNNAYSVSIWFRPNTTGDYSTYGEGASSGSRSNSLYSGSSGLMNSANSYGAGRSTATSSNYEVANAQNIQIGTYSASNGAYIYLNNVKSANASPITLDFANHTRANLGRDYYVTDADTVYSQFYGRMDELKIYNYELSTDEAKLIYNSELDLNFVTFGAKENEAPIPQTRITFTVYRTGTTTHLTGVSMDCNVNALDLSAQNSPFYSAYVNEQTSASCIFSKTGFDNNTQSFYFDTNKSATVYLSVSTPCSATGGTTYDIGTRRIHRFDSNSTLTVSGTCDMNVLVIAGGGAGGKYYGGGGGAGGLIYDTAKQFLAGDYNITIGAGGVAQTGVSALSNGKNSKIYNATYGTIYEAIGGGSASRGNPQADNEGAMSGGSAGGEGGYTPSTNSTNPPDATATAGQGNTGGMNVVGNYKTSGGGGGAGASGGNNTTSTSGNGGAGLSYDINGTSICYAGGGGGGAGFDGGSGTAGTGTCGGGNGSNSTYGTVGKANTGGGGGGSQQRYIGADGGSGIVIVTYIIQENPCDPTINQDWVLTTEQECYNATMDLGTGKLILSTGGILKLFSSTITTKRFDINASGSQLWLDSGSWIKID